MPEQRPRRKKGGGRGGGGNSKSGRQAEGEDEDCDDSPDSFSLSNSSTSEYNEEENNEEDEEEEEEEMQVGEVNDEDDDDVDKNGSRSSSRSRNRSSSFRNNNKPPGTVVAAASRSASGNLVSASAAASHEASNNKEKKRKRIRRKSRSNHSDDGTTGADKRRTEAGGYAHTVESRLAISRANRGNVPWNKGRKRSGTDVAKIRAGVQARNNLLAKQKREAYSLTLEEDQRLRRQIKYWREKVRRMKVDNDRRQQIKAENAREWATIETGLARLRQASRGARSSSLDSDASSEEEDDDDDNDDNCQDKAAGNGITEDGGDGQPEQGQQQEGRSPVRLLSDDPVVWAPVHELGEGRIVCPNHDHGSGGFACCQDCWDRSVRCLVETAKDLERQRISSVGLEVVQLQEAATALTRTIEQTSRSTRRTRSRMTVAAFPAEGAMLPPTNRIPHTAKRGGSSAAAPRASGAGPLALPRLKDPPPRPPPPPRSVGGGGGGGGGDEPPFRSLIVDPTDPSYELFEV